MEGVTSRFTSFLISPLKATTQKVSKYLPTVMKNENLIFFGGYLRSLYGAIHLTL